MFLDEFDHIIKISIHALREESDITSRKEVRDLGNFNPRPPRGERQVVLSVRLFPVSGFQSTPSARRATRARGVLRLNAGISIHALREESDMEEKRPSHSGTISIHALREESDEIQSELRSRRDNFNPRPPRGERQQKQRKNPMLLFHYTHLCTI